MFYNIDNERIYLAECLHCKAQASKKVSEFTFNSLEDIKKTARCCDKKTYLWIKDEARVPNNFSDP